MYNRSIPLLKTGTQQPTSGVNEWDEYPNDFIPKLIMELPEGTDLPRKEWVALTVQG